MKEIKFSVKVTAGDIFGFTFYHLYHSMSGIVAVFMAICALVLMIITKDITTQSRVILLLVISWVFLLDPLRLYFSAKKQAKKNPAYQKPIDYTVNEQGITVSQGDQSQAVAWSSIFRIKETGKLILVYTNYKNAFIFPKSAMDGCVSDFKEIARDALKDRSSRLKFKKDK